MTSTILRVKCFLSEIALAVVCLVPLVGMTAQAQTHHSRLMIGPGTPRRLVAIPALAPHAFETGSTVYVPPTRTGFQAVKLLDTRTGATVLTPPFGNRTYTGEVFTNNALPSGTVSFTVTAMTVFMWAATSASYSDVVGQVQLWNGWSQTSSPVFTSPVTPVIFDLGPMTTSANTVYAFDLDLSGSPITLTGGSGHTWGWSQNFRSDTGSGLADNNDLTTPYGLFTNGYPAGQVVLGSFPPYAVYANASGRTDLNFLPTDAQTTGSEVAVMGLSIIIYGNPNVPTAANVSVEGRVTDDHGSGIRRAIVRMSDGRGVTVSRLTNSFGYFHFTLQSGSTYIISAQARGFTFTPRVVFVNNQITNLDIRALP